MDAGLAGWGRLPALGDFEAEGGEATPSGGFADSRSLATRARAIADAAPLRSAVQITSCGEDPREGPNAAGFEESACKKSRSSFVFSEGLATNPAKRAPRGLSSMPRRARWHVLRTSGKG